MAEPASSPQAAVAGRVRLIRYSFGLVAIVGALGMVIAMAMATSAWWWAESASALGTDLTGGRYFNLTMVLLGIAFVPLAIVVGLLLKDAAATGLVDPRWAMASRIGLLVIPIAFVFVGWFRIDEGSRASAIHNVAGFTIPLVVMAMMLTAGFGTRGMWPRFSWRSLAILGAIVALFVVSELGLMSYALMEMLSFVICWWWLLGLANRFDRRLPGHPTARVDTAPSAAT